MIAPENSWMLLKRHPSDFAGFDAFHLESKTQIDPTTHILKISFRLTGPVSDILWPKEEPNTSLSRDQKLWEHTCFELFIGTSHSQNYFEWNLSTAKKWGHFRFESYRKPTNGDLSPGGILNIEFKREVNSARLTAEIKLSEITELSTWVENKSPLLLSTTAILESKRGEKSHWALSHQDAVPNFHQSSSFIAKIL